MNIIIAEKIGVNFGKEKVFANLSFKIEKGSKTALFGASGKGKTTILNLIAGFIPDFEGNIKIFEKELNFENISEIRKQISWLPQETGLDFKTARELIFGVFDFNANKQLKPTDDKVKEMMDLFLLSPDLLEKSSSELSGGQKQRMLLISCLLNKKPLLLLDEPTSALDDISKKIVADYIFSQNEITVISSTHDSYWIQNSNNIINL